MSKRLEVKENGVKSYDIVIEHEINGFLQEYRSLGYENRRVCIVSDSNVSSLYGEELRKLLLPAAKTVELFVFPAGEANKTLDTVKALYAFLIQRQFDRKDCLVALGGGVTGDLAGYAAATYLRGIDYIQVPTSILAMVDSSVGGKTGVDFDAYKNMVGAFKMPRLVYMNLSYLKSLPEEQYFNGMAETVKYGLICDLEYYLFLLSHMTEILDQDPIVIEQMVAKSCQAKKEIVEEDPMEKGLRALLNFGHTSGHAIEKLMDFRLLHGQCVALGMVCAAYLSYRRGMIEKEEYLEIRDVLIAFRLPVTLEEGPSAEEIIAMTKSDKKMDGGSIRFVLLKSVGEAYVDGTVSDGELKEALEATVLSRAEDVTDESVVKLSDILGFADGSHSEPEDGEESHEN